MAVLLSHPPHFVWLFWSQTVHLSLDVCVFLASVVHSGQPSLTITMQCRDCSVSLNGEAEKTSTPPEAFGPVWWQLSTKCLSLKAPYKRDVWRSHDSVVRCPSAALWRGSVSDGCISSFCFFINDFHLQSYDTPHSVGSLFNLCVYLTFSPVCRELSGIRQFFHHAVWKVIMILVAVYISYISNPAFTCKWKV